MALWLDSHCRARQAADIICQAGAGLLSWDTHHWASPALSQAGLSAMVGEMPAERQGLGRAGPGARGGPQLHRRDDWHQLLPGSRFRQEQREAAPAGSEGAWAARRGPPPSLGSSGPASFGMAVGETCWVSSHVFPHKAGSCSPGCKVGVRGGSSLLMLTFT